MKPKTAWCRFCLQFIKMNATIYMLYFPFVVFFPCFITCVSFDLYELLIDVVFCSNVIHIVSIQLKKEWWLLGKKRNGDSVMIFFYQSYFTIPCTWNYLKLAYNYCLLWPKARSKALSLLSSMKFSIQLLSSMHKNAQKSYQIRSEKYRKHTHLQYT